MEHDSLLNVLMIFAARSHSNSYIFYEVANSYKFMQPQLVQIHMIFAKLYVFYELQPNPDPSLKLPVTEV